MVLYLEEIVREGYETDEIGLTGGEPFMNPDILNIIRSVLERGFSLLVLTNGMRPMMRPAIRSGLLKLHAAFRNKLTIRVSVDHFDQVVHEKENNVGRTLLRCVDSQKGQGHSQSDRKEEFFNHFQAIHSASCVNAVNLVL